MSSTQSCAGPRADLTRRSVPWGKRVRQNRRWLLDTAAAHAIRNIAVFAASQQRLSDITAAIAAIRAHLERGDLSDGLIFDAVRIKLLEIGEAVKSVPVEVTSAEPRIPWTHIARMRDHLGHRCFDTSHAIVAATPEHHLPGLADAGAQLGTLESRFLRSKA